jgi:hypothetical protein
MIQGLDALRQSQEQLISGQQQMVDQLLEREKGDLRKVDSSGAISSLADDDDNGSVPSTVVLDDKGQHPSKTRRWYAVAVGRRVGIFDTKQAAMKSVLKFPNGCYKGFRSKPAAQEWLDLRRLKRSNEQLIPDNLSFKSTDETQYSPDKEAGSSPQRPIDAILDITKVGHDPSVGDPKRMYNTPTDVDAVLLKTLCPKGVTQAVREQLLEAAPDILQAPGKLPAGSSTTDAAAIADSLANAFEQIADVQAVKSGLIVPRDTQFRNPNRNYLNDKTLRTLEDLETGREELEAQASEIMGNMEATICQILFVNGWTRGDIDIFLASGLLPNVMRSTMALYQALWMHLCTLTLKHPFRVVSLHIKHHADKLRTLRVYATTRCRLIVRSYIYLRDAKHKNYRDQSISDKIMLMALPSFLSLKSLELPSHNPETRAFDCTHCMSDLHLRVPCPGKRLKAKRARELAIVAARTIDVDPEAFDHLCQAES